MNDHRALLKRFIKTLNQVSRVYHLNSLKYAKNLTEYWLLYALGDGKVYSQKELSEEWLIPRTTLNSCVKKCEAEGYLKLEPIPGKRREMYMYLTESGKAHAQRMINITYRAENRAMDETIARYSDEFLSAFEFYRHTIERTLNEEFEAHVLNMETLDEKE